MADRLPEIDRYLEANVERWLGELADLCRVPSVSARHEGIEDCAQLVREVLARRGFEAEVVPSDGHPVVLARGGSAPPVMLLYNHYDVQPPEPLGLWTSPPFELTQREDRVYARGAKDDKGELVARLAAIDALQSLLGRLPCTVTWLVEGEEEVGSPNLPAFCERHAERLRCDGSIWEEGGIDAEGRPLVTLGVRGLLYVELRVRSSARDGHSGEANLVPNAAWRLIWALATLKDQNERVLIPGFYERVPPVSERQREMLERLPDEEASIRASYGLDRLLLDRHGADVRGARFEPTCNVAGITGGYQGAGAKTVIPASASAKVDFRLLPGQDPLEILALLNSHLERQGFGEVEVELIGGERAALVDPDSPLVRLAVETGQEVYGKPALLVPMSGGTTPMYLVTEQGVPVVAPGVGYGSSNRAHSPDESIRVRDLVDAARHIARLLIRFGEL
ncbi:MAG: M20/M25/M40 family metallo-hydrolase [Candidatus Dormibacteraeota bacterium]|nr:M20/M25/M40 family metallo-hydrolase [Candidatus Dormibacteraeota bacterium]